MIPWLLFLLLSRPAVEPEARVTVSDTIEEAVSVIDRVDIEIGNVFDPTIDEENRFAFRLANRLHRKTREDVVRRKLLFRAGDVLDPERLEESERILRREPFLFEPTIHFDKDQDGASVVKVEARDVWTLKAGASFGRQGGANRSSIEVSDSNFLGLGKDLTLRYSTDVDRNGLLLRYEDPQWLGSHVRVGATVEDRSDGNLVELLIERPFFSLDERYTWGAGALEETRFDSRYFRGEVVDHFFRRRRFAEVYRGWSMGIESDQHIRRLRLGWTYDSNRFESPVLGPVSDDGFLADLPFPVLSAPRDRTFSELWLDWQSFENTFQSKQNLDKIGRTEDRNLGSWIRWRVGTSLEALGASENSLMATLNLGHSAETPAGWLVEGSTHLEGRYRLDPRSGAEVAEIASNVDNLRLGVEGRLYHPSENRRRAFFVHGLADYVIDPDLDTQLLLGGDSGLRGYPLRYQDGDRRWLLTVEERFFTRWSMFSLFDIGAAVFADVGRSWDPDRPEDPGSGILADVGAGLRLGMKRSGRGSVVHLDLAMPLGGGDDISSLQWLVSSHRTF